MSASRVATVRVRDTGDDTHNFGRLVTSVAERFPATGGVLVIEPSATEFPEKPADEEGGLSPEHPALASARDAGWKVGKIRNGWGKLRHPDRPTVNLCLLGWQSPDTFPLIHGDVHYTVLALHCWHALTGRPWFGTPGTAGSDVLEPHLEAIRPRGAVLRLRSQPPGYEAPYLGSTWGREEDAPHVHRYDANRMYLSGALVAEVAPWNLKPTGPRTFDRKLAGWWLIDVPPWNDPRMPDPAGYDPEPRRWVTTATAALLAELADEGLSAGFSVLDSYVGTSRRLFRPWAERMNGAHQEAARVGADRLAGAIKQASARETLGLFASPSYTTYRPDWWATIVAISRANLWRKLWRIGNATGRWPVKIETDCVWYTSTSPDAVVSCPDGLLIGTGLGQFKVKG